MTKWLIRAAPHAAQRVLLPAAVALGVSLAAVSDACRAELLLAGLQLLGS